MGGDRTFDLDNLLKLVDPEPVRIDPQACLVARHRRSHCRRCTSACPHAALRVDDGKVVVDTASCHKCGLCAGACPTAAMTVHGIDDGAVLAAAAVHCSRAKGGGIQVPCLGYLSVDHLLTMGLRHPSVALTCGQCDTCPWQAGGERAREAVRTASALLAALGSSHTVQMAAATGAEGAGPGLSRRELFGLWRTESTQVARQFLPEQKLNYAQLPTRLPARRGRWLRQISQEDLPDAAMPQGPWKARRAGDACTGCGICASFCPTGALAAQAADGHWTLTHQPAACVDCGTCVDLCPVRTMDEEPLTVPAMVGAERREVISLVTRRCRSCRREFKGRPEDEQCPNCRSVFASFR